MQCLEIYTGESYSIGLNFTDVSGNPISLASYTLSASAKYYSVDTVVYNDALGEIDLGNITEQSPQGTAPTITVTTTSPSGGIASMFIPSDLTDGSSGRPTVELTNGKGDPSILVIVSVDIARPDTDVPSNTNLSKEPIGFIVRYQ
jgi:hypothetical protein